MITAEKWPLGLVFATSLIILPAGALAQEGAGFFAPTKAMDTLNEAPVGPGGAGAVALDRARAIGGPGGPAPGMAPAPGVAPAPGMAPGVAPAPGMAPGVAPAPGAAVPGPEGGILPAFALQKKQVKVIEGTRIYCKITGKLLQDATERFVEEDAVKAENSGYHDDGQNGDAFADDGVYTKIEFVSDKYISTEANSMRRRLQSLVLQWEDQDPIDAFLQTVVSTDLTTESQVVTETMLEEERDKKVCELASGLSSYFVTPVLNPFEDNKDKVGVDPLVTPEKIEFWPVYLPPPPPKPAVPLPPGFNPTVKPGETAKGEEGAQPPAEEAPAAATGYYNTQPFMGNEPNRNANEEE